MRFFLSKIVALKEHRVESTTTIKKMILSSKVYFKYMFNEAKTVRIEGSDSETGIKSIHYYISSSTGVGSSIFITLVLSVSSNTTSLMLIIFLLCSISFIF